MPSCHDVASRIAQGHLSEQPLGRRLGVWLHLVVCRYCRRFWWEMRLLNVGLKSVLDDLSRDMPADLAQRTLAQLNESSSPTAPEAGRGDHRSGAWTGFVPTWGRIAAVSAMGVVMVGVWTFTADRPASAWRDHLVSLTADHQQAGGATFTSSDSDAIQQWLGERLGFAAHVPEIPDTRLAGARFSRLDGREMAALVYDVDGEQVSFYLTPAGTADPMPLEPAEIVGGEDAGYQAIAWQGDGLTHALVGALPSERLRTMAQYCLDMPDATTGS